MRKSVAVVTLLGALLTGGAIGLALFGAAASAQTDSSSSAPSSSSPSSGSSSSPDSSSSSPDSSSSSPDQSGPPMGRHGFGHGIRGPHPDMALVASTIGISEDDLRTAIEGGQSIADVAKAHNVDPQTVIDALVADASKNLDQAVTDGKLTQSQADQMKADLPQRMADFVNNAGMAGGCPGMGGPGDGAGPGSPAPGGQAPGSDSSSSSSSTPNTNTVFRF